VLADGYRLTSLLNGHKRSKHAKFSPSLILLGHLVKRIRGARGGGVDLGVGRAPYKSSFLPPTGVPIRLLYPIHARGHMAAAIYATAFAANRMVKRSDALSPLVEIMRRSRGRWRGAPSYAALRAQADT
jgi:CelD/BcsL family acetyltransferase involved in cellulose biosynthesis